MADQTVHVGDIIEIDGKVGRVENIKIRTTRAVTFDNKVLIIPNHKYLTSTLFNWTENGTILRGRVSVGVSYDSDLEKVAQVTQEVADNVAKNLDICSKNQDPVVRFFEFGDSSVNLKVYFKAEKYGDQHSIIDVFIRRLHKRYGEEGIDIPYPIRTLIHKNAPK